MSRAEREALVRAALEAAEKWMRKAGFKHEAPLMREDCDPAAIAAGVSTERQKLDYDILHQFADENRINYNSLCNTVRAAIAAGVEPRCKHGTRHPHRCRECEVEEQDNLRQEQDELAALRARVKELEQWNKEMVELSASGGRLDGYREMGRQLAEKDEQIDALRARIDYLEEFR